MTSNTMARLSATGLGLTLSTLTWASFVMNQVGNAGQISAPIYPTVNYLDAPSFTTYAWDDFTITASGLTNFVETHVYAQGLLLGTNWPQNVPWEVTIRIDQAGAPGTIILAFIVPGASVSFTPNYSLMTGNGFVNALVHIPVSAALAPESYWVSCTPQDFIVSGRVYATGRSTWAGGSPHNSNSWIDNPGNGWGLGTTQMFDNWPLRVDM